MLPVLKGRKCMFQRSTYMSTQPQGRRTPGQCLPLARRGSSPEELPESTSGPLRYRIADLHRRGCIRQLAGG